MNPNELFLLKSRIMTIRESILIIFLPNGSRMIQDAMNERYVKLFIKKFEAQLTEF